MFTFLLALVSSILILAQSAAGNQPIIVACRIIQTAAALKLRWRINKRQGNSIAIMLDKVVFICNGLLKGMLVKTKNGHTLLRNNKCSGKKLKDTTPVL